MSWQQERALAVGLGSFFFVHLIGGINADNSR